MVTAAAVVYSRSMLRPAARLFAPDVKPAPEFLVDPALLTVGLARSGYRGGRKAPPSPELSVKSRRLKHYGRRDILAAFGIANNEGHGHQLPSMQIIDRDVASQISVVEALPRFALNQDNGCFGIVHARTSRTLWGRRRPTPAKKTIRGRAASAQLGATHARDQGLSGCFLAKICACPAASSREAMRSPLRGWGLSLNGHWGEPGGSSHPRRHARGDLNSVSED